MTGLIEVRSLINGQWIESERVVLVNDYEGLPRVRLHAASETQVRIAKRAALQVRDELAQVPFETLLRVVKRAGRAYFLDTHDCETVARLSGSPITYARNSMALFREFVSHIDLYVQNAFGSHTYEHIPVRIEGTEVAYRTYVPTAPVVAVIPQNVDGVSAYIIAQILLSKNPALVKPSSRGGSAFSTMRFIEALHAAIDIEAPQYPCLRRAIQLINVVDDEQKDRATQVADLAIQGVNVVLFGSDSSVTKLAEAINANVKPRTILRLGTGFSVTLIMPDADLRRSVDDTLACILADRGNQCTTTHVLYVHEDIYDVLVGELRRAAAGIRLHDPLDERACTGCLDDATRASVEKRLFELHPQHMLSERTSPVSIIEVEDHAPVEELPGPLLFVKKVTSVDNFCDTHARDRSRTNATHSLAVSVYTEDQRVIDRCAARLSTHIIKWNMPTHEVNLFLEHQGLFILKELLSPRLVQKARHSLAAHAPLSEVRQ